MGRSSCQEPHIFLRSLLRCISEWCMAFGRCWSARRKSPQSDPLYSKNGPSVVVRTLSCGQYGSREQVNTKDYGTSDGWMDGQNLPRQPTFFGPLWIKNKNNGINYVISNLYTVGWGRWGDYSNPQIFSNFW